jgi:hypothetical protein
VHVSSSSPDGSHFASPNVLLPSDGRGGATWYVIGRPSGPSRGDDDDDDVDAFDDDEATRGARATRARRSTTRWTRRCDTARVVDAGASRARMANARGRVRAIAVVAVGRCGRSIFGSERARAKNDADDDRARRRDESRRRA